MLFYHLSFPVLKRWVFYALVNMLSRQNAGCSMPWLSCCHNYLVVFSEVPRVFRVRCISQTADCSYIVSHIMGCALASCRRYKLPQVGPQFLTAPAQFREGCNGHSQSAVLSACDRGGRWEAGSAPKLSESEKQNPWFKLPTDEPPPPKKKARIHFQNPKRKQELHKNQVPRS